MKTYLSIIIPVFNEEESLQPLYQQLTAVLKELKMGYEIIFIDDGSRDSSYQILEKLHLQDKKVRGIKFRKNFGQSAALDAGFRAAEGEIIVALDADMQNDPADIPLLLKEMEKGYDVVSGWRYDRKDNLSKKLASLMARFLRNFIAKDKVHDSGCTLKAYKKECFQNLRLYGEMHRYIPLLLMWQGFKIGEVKVTHHQRKLGKTKYGVGRIFRGLLDLVAIKFFADYSVKPLHFFAKMALVNFLLSGLIVAYYISRFQLSFVVGPLLLAAMMFFLIGVVLFCFGFLAEIQIRVLFSRRDHKNYFVEKVL